MHALKSCHCKDPLYCLPPYDDGVPCLLADVKKEVAGSLFVLKPSKPYIIVGSSLVIRWLVGRIQGTDTSGGRSTIQVLPIGRLFL